MATETSRHIALCQVLEEEYTALYGLVSPDRTDDESGLYHIHQEIHKKKPAALCLSGGGIRSATFSLGVLQGLAEYGLLDKFEYLSTVSGGGYVGSWLSAWIHHKGLSHVANQLKSSPKDSTGQSFSPLPALDPEPTPIRHLREYSNYPNPKLGLFSADTWTLIATYLRNVLLNWSVLIPLLAALLMLPRLAVAGTELDPRTFAFGMPLRIAMLFLGCILAASAIDYVNLNLPSSQSAQKNPDRFMRRCLFPLLASAVLLTTYWAWTRTTGNDPPHIGWFIVFGIALHLLGCAQVLRNLRNTVGVQKRQTVGDFVLIVIAGAGGGFLVWMIVTSVDVFLYPQRFASYYASFAAPLLLLLFMVATALYVGLASFSTSDEDREWWARAGAWTLIVIVAWSGLSTLVIFGPMALSAVPKTIASLGGLAGVITILIGWSAKTPANDQETKTGQSSILMKAGLAVAAPLFALFFIVLLSWGTSWLISLFLSVPIVDELLPFRTSLFYTYLHTRGLALPLDYLILAADIALPHWWIIDNTPLWLIVGIALVLGSVGLIMGFHININKFSLHTMYRDRLVRAYLGASRDQRNPHPFTGFDADDNIQMYELRHQRPFHVVNIALNLVGGKNLAWQERKAESFTFSRLHAGSSRLGYRRAREYGGKKGYDGETDGVSLGTAMAISGAAASPNMGYQSSSVVTFLMTLFNARLGWWLGNPGPAGDQTVQRSSFLLLPFLFGDFVRQLLGKKRMLNVPTFATRGPEFSVGPMIQEALGLTDDQKPYVYLSDGGHFENLGLYEMVLRRCHVIVVSDAGNDPRYTFEDLGNAIRKIRIDLGVPIELSQIAIFPREPQRPGKYCAIGTIRYSSIDGNVEDGTLIYLKPAFYGDEPADVYNYAQMNSFFPHDPTLTDQWFSESQFESYRALGQHIVRTLGGRDWENICAKHGEEAKLTLFAKQVRSYLTTSGQGSKTGSVPV